jgi:hypothetical protein
MYTWSIRLVWCPYLDSEDFEFPCGDKNEPDCKSKHYYAKGDDDIEALDKALTLFLKDFNLDFDTDIENIDWGYCRV